MAKHAAVLHKTWHPTFGWTSENGQIRDLQGDLNVPEEESVKNMLSIPGISKACEDYVEVVRTDARLFDLYFADRSIDFLPHLQQLMHDPHHVFPGSTTLRPNIEALQQLHHMSVHDTPLAPASGPLGQGDVNMEPASADSEVARLRNELARERAEKAQLFQSQQAAPRLPQTAMAPQFGSAQQLALQAPPAQPVLVQGHAGAPGDEVLGPDKLQNNAFNRLAVPTKVELRVRFPDSASCAFHPNHTHTNVQCNAQRWRRPLQGSSTSRGGSRGGKHRNNRAESNAFLGHVISKINRDQQIGRGRS